MTFDAAIVAASVILSITMLITIIVVSRRRLAAKEEELRQQASMRGWTFQRARGKGVSRAAMGPASTDGVCVDRGIARWSNPGQRAQPQRAAKASPGHPLAHGAGLDTITKDKAPALAPIVLMGIPEGKGPRGI